MNTTARIARDAAPVVADDDGSTARRRKLPDPAAVDNDRLLAGSDQDHFIFNFALAVGGLVEAASYYDARSDGIDLVHFDFATFPAGPFADADFHIGAFVETGDLHILPDANTGFLF
jgi:hypothetical protein